MPNIGIPELLIVLVIVLVIFGAGRLTDIMGALGKGVAEFRKGSGTDNEIKDTQTPMPNVQPKQNVQQPMVSVQQPVPNVQPQGTASQFNNEQKLQASRLASLGNTRAIEGASAEAIQYLEQARQIYKNIGDKHAEAQACFSLSSVFDVALHDNAKATQLLKEGLALDPENGHYREILDQKMQAH